jgi:hypothetical protein
VYNVVALQEKAARRLATLADVKGPLKKSRRLRTSRPVEIVILIYINASDET